MSDNIPSVVDKSLLDSVDKYVKSFPDGKDAIYVIDRFIRETQRHIKLVKFCASKFQEVLDPAIYIKLLANVKEHDADVKNKHYISDHQPIETMQSNMTHEELIGFLKGNIIKYACRCGKKDEPLKEAEKIKQYAEWLCIVLSGGTINPRS